MKIIIIVIYSDLLFEISWFPTDIDKTEFCDFCIFIIVILRKIYYINQIYFHVSFPICTN